MKIYLGTDHRGFNLKNELAGWLKSQGHEVIDLGALVFDPKDSYVDFTRAVARKIQAEPASRGVVICGSGVGVAIAANRFSGIRCALGFAPEQIKHARENDDINILALPSEYLDFAKSQSIVTAFLEGQFKNEAKYQERIARLEKV